jgi:hypothetical protein
MKIIRQLSIVQFMFMGAVAFGQTNLPFQHPRDQIALQLGAIQMGYSVPFQLVGNPTSAQQAANALAMGRNILAATPAKPAVKVQGFVSSPAVDSVEFRDQLYQAVEAVVTTPVIGSIKGSVMLNNGKKQSISATLSLPPITYTIPTPWSRPRVWMRSLWPRRWIRSLAVSLQYKIKTLPCRQRWDHFPAT